MSENKHADLLADLNDRYGRALVLRRWQNAQALLRRKETTPSLRERLKQLVPQLEAQAAREGIKLKGWRQYPDKEGNLVFGTELREGDLEFVAPERRKRASKPTKRAAGEMLKAVEESLDVETTAEDDLAKQLEASLRARGIDPDA